MIPSLEATLKVVFSIFGVFWVVVVVGLYFAVGALMAHADRLARNRARDGHSASH